MDAFVSDLVRRRDLVIPEKAWVQIVEALRSIRALDAEALDRLASPEGRRMDLSEHQARKIGRGLWRWMLNDLIRQRQAAQVPSYIVPIATSSGVWVDPALAVMNRPIQFPNEQMVSFADFCLRSKGLFIN